jgi:cell division protein FtsL
MSIDVEYAIKKDIRNNPVIREIDLDQKRDFIRTAGIAALVVAMLLFSAWQQFKIVQHGYDVEDLRELIAVEEAEQRQLRLELETLRRPQEIERRAVRELGLVPPSPDDVVVIERVRPSSPAGAIIAEAR